MNHTTHLTARLAAFTVASALIAMGGAVTAAQPSPTDTVEQLVSSPHGLTWASGQARIQALLDQVRADPGTYLPLLLAVVDGDAARSDAEALRRAQNAAEAIIRAGGDGGRAQLATKIASLLTAAGKEQAQLAKRAAAMGKGDKTGLDRVRREMLAVGRALQLARTSVAAFAEAGDPRLVDAVIGEVGTQDASTRLTLYDYLRRTARGDATVAARLETRWKAPADSPIRSDPQLERTILVIRRSEPPKTAPSTPKARVERLLMVPTRAPLDPADAATLRQAQADPATHLAALETVLAGYDPTKAKGQAEIMRFESAAALLGALDVPAAAERLGTWFVALDAASRDPALVRRRGDLARMRSAAIDALGARAPEAVRKHVVANLPAMDRAARRQVYAMLLACCREDADLAEGLRRLRADKRTGLVDDRDFAAFYARLTKR